MLARIRAWLTPPAFEYDARGYSGDARGYSGHAVPLPSGVARPGYADVEASNAAVALNTMLLVAFAALVLFLSGLLFAGDRVNPLVIALCAAMLVTCVGSLVLLRRGRVRLAGAVASVVFWIAFTVPAFLFGGMHDPAVLGYFVVIVLSGIVLGGYARMAFAALCLLSVVALYAAEHTGVITPEIGLPTIFSDLLLAVLAMGTTAVLVGYTVRRMTGLYSAAQGSRAALEESNAQLQASRDMLAGQTRDLERRARYLEATAAVARDTTLELDIEELLPRLVRLVSERLGYYHAGIFFLEPEGEWLALQAASSEGGRRMLARGHRLRVGQGVVGHAAEARSYRVLMDTRGTVDEAGNGAGQDAKGTGPEGDVFFDNPELPETHSEAALPLMARGELIGVLDVQSRQRNAFGEEDLVALQALANQLAVALSNARLYWEAQRALEAERGAYGELSRQAWQELLRLQPELAVVKSGRDILPVSTPPDDEVRRALQTGQPVVGRGGEDGGQSTSVVVPIRVRGPKGTWDVIGAIDAHKPAGGGEWTPEQVALLQAVCEQLGDALDDARMYRDAQRRAARERTLSEVTGRVRESLDVDVVLRRAVQEMRQALGVAEVEVRLDTFGPDGQGVGG